MAHWTGQPPHFAAAILDPPANASAKIPLAGYHSARVPVSRCVVHPGRVISRSDLNVVPIWLDSCPGLVGPLMQ